MILYMDFSGFLTTAVLCAFCWFIGYLKGYEDGKNNFICLDDEFTYSRCVFQCNDCALYEKQLDENKDR